MPSHSQVILALIWISLRVNLNVVKEFPWEKTSYAQYSSEAGYQSLEENVDQELCGAQKIYKQHLSIATTFYVKKLCESFYMRYLI